MTINEARRPCNGATKQWHGSWRNVAIGVLEMSRRRRTLPIPTCLSALVTTARWKRGIILHCMNDPQPEGHMASYIERRKFLATLGGAAAAWPLAAARTAGRAGAAACRGRNADTDPEGRAWFSAFRQGLQDLGWVEGRNFRAD